MLLVPGYGGSTGSLEVLAAKIRANRRTATVVPLAGNGTGDLQVQANVLNGYVNQALRDGPVTVIGYSAGGVVAWLWDVEYGGATKAREIITLGSPLHGTSLAALGEAFVPGECPQACEQLVPGSALLTRLSHSDPASRPRWLSLWTTDDQVVQPPDSASLPGAVNVPLQSVCPGVSIQHGQLPSTPLVIGIILNEIAHPGRSAPTAADCRALLTSASLPLISLVRIIRPISHIMREYAKFRKIRDGKNLRSGGKVEHRGAAWQERTREPR